MRSKILKEYFNAEGVLVTVYRARAPRAGERTWPMVKGSAAHMGAKALSLATHGVVKRKHG
jgi:hypothetical protein